MLTGTVFLPDGTTPAAAAVVDLMLAEAGGQPVPGSSFARAVSDVDGRFELDPPETEELVALARGAGGTLDTVVQVGKLLPAGTVTTAGLDAVDAVGSRLGVDLHLGSDPTGVVFEFGRDVMVPVSGVVTQVLRLAEIAWMFDDPDLVAGNEDLDDPDVIPPLGSSWTARSARSPRHRRYSTS